MAGLATNVVSVVSMVSMVSVVSAANPMSPDFKKVRAKAGKFFKWMTSSIDE
jgi:hypothetical protein